MDEPRSLLQGLQRRAKGEFVNELLKPFEVLQCVVPLLHQDVRCQLPPQPIQIVLVGRLTQNAVKVQISGCVLVISNFVQAFGVVVASVNPFRLEIVMPHQVFLKLFSITGVLDLKAKQVVFSKNQIRLLISKITCDVTSGFEKISKRGLVSSCSLRNSPTTALLLSCISSGTS